MTHLYIIKNLRLPATETFLQDLPETVSKALNLDLEDVDDIRLVKQSIDARRKPKIDYVISLTCLLRVPPRATPEGVTIELNPPVREIPSAPQMTRKLSLPPVIIGSGPAGTFAALALAEAGQPCIIVERGEAVEQRMRTVHNFRRHGEFKPESNYCFGEGGAGTFSDGKLTCGRNHPLIETLFRTWVKFGAPEEILYQAHPHIGTDYLMRIAIRMRHYLKEQGCTYFFGRRFVDFQPGQGCRWRVSLDDGTHIDTDHLIIAIGHSARDTYEMLVGRGLSMAPKPFAVGARFEHPQDLINRIQYGSCDLPLTAEYKLAAHSEHGRGIWTFCMCPGGHLLPTSAQPGHLAINGMSYHGRKSGFANAAIVVNVNREDFFRGHVLDGMRFQERIEQKAFRAAGGGYISPAQRLQDFLDGRTSVGELKSTYRPGVASVRIDKLLPEFIVTALKVALKSYNQKMRGFISHDALIAGVESKTSAPITMLRNADGQSLSHPGIYPCGEGAGFAGGIVSAALDGLRLGRNLVMATSLTGGGMDAVPKESKADALPS